MDDPFAKIVQPTQTDDQPVGAPTRLTAEQQAEHTETLKLAAIRTKTREQAIERGRQAGTHEANQRNETGSEAQNRVKRAMAYAAWEHDGKPLAYGNHYQKEFKLPTIDHIHNWLQHNGPDNKPKKQR